MPLHFLRFPKEQFLKLRRKLNRTMLWADVLAILLPGNLHNFLHKLLPQP